MATSADASAGGDVGVGGNDQGGQAPNGEALTCDNVDYQGCCTPAGAVVFCEEGEAWQDNCDGGGCGWNPAFGVYDCRGFGMGSGSSDHPFLCPGFTCDDPCGGQDCGYDCGVACGECPQASYCGTGGVCKPCSCEGFACGEDPCGNSCGTCPAGTYCTGNLQCADCHCDGASCGDDGCGQSCGECPEGLFCDFSTRSCVTDVCAGIGPTGCCEGSTVLFCLAGELNEEPCDDECGWSANDAWYQCGGEGADPSGAYPRECPEFPEAGDEPGN